MSISKVQAISGNCAVREKRVLPIGKGRTALCVTSWEWWQYSEPRSDCQMATHAIPKTGADTRESNRCYRYIDMVVQ